MSGVNLSAVVLEIDAGQGAPRTYDLGVPNESGDLDETVYGGNLYLTIDGRLYGSLYVRYDNVAGHPVITLGQLDAETQMWEPCNEIGPEVTDTGEE